MVLLGARGVSESVYTNVSDVDSCHPYQLLFGNCLESLHYAWQMTVSLGIVVFLAVLCDFIFFFF